MTTEVTLPTLGESVSEGTVTRWLKKVGDTIAVDEALVEISTDKVDTEIPSPVSGTLLEIKADEDDTVEVGAVLAIVGAESTETSEAPSPGDGGEGRSDPAPTPTSEHSAHPAALGRHAEEPGPNSVGREPSTGSDNELGPRTPVVLPSHPDPVSSSDRAAVDAAPRPQQLAAASPLRGRTKPLSRLRKIIAERMMDSLRLSAQLTTVVEVDVTTIARLRESAKADFVRREGVKLTFLPFFAKAALDALKQHPSLNAALDMDAGQVTYFDKENLAVAVDSERGLLTPVIEGAGDLSVAGLARKIADVAERTRTNRLSPDELSGGTFTITNTGSRGALFDTPIINQPQVAILGTGTIVKRAVVIDDANLGETIAIRSMVYLALTYDHRLVDGADAARYLSDVKARLEAGTFDV